MTEQRMTGRVVSFKISNGWGFIAPDDGGPDVFVHLKQSPCLWTLYVGERVTFTVAYDARGRRHARDCLPADGRKLRY
jgi:CspA family cold shock protein